MDEQTASIAFVSVPASEIVGAVGGIKGPFEVYGVHFANNPLSFYIVSIQFILGR